MSNVKYYRWAAEIKAENRHQYSAWGGHCFPWQSSLGEWARRRSLIVTRTGEAEAVGKDSTLEMFSYDINVKKMGELAAGHEGIRFCKMRRGTYTMSVCQSS